MLLEAVKSLFVPACWTSIACLVMFHIVCIPALMSPKIKRNLADIPQLLWSMGTAMAAVAIVILTIKQHS